VTAPATSSSPLVSILINNYNYADYLPVAIRSVLKQTYPQTEVVVVDDGSTDASRQVIEMFSGQVSIVLQENSGQPAAGQAGLKASSGDIVMFLDADDFLYPDAVSRVVDAWQPGCSKVQFRLSLVDADGIRFGADPPWGLPMPSGDLLGQLAATGRYQTPVTSGNAFPRTLLERLFPFSAEFDALDHYLNTVVPLFGPVISIEDELGAYRQHGRNRWAFSGGVNIDRLRERVRYDLIKERQLHQTAAEQGLYLPSNLVQCNPEHLLHRLGSLRLDPVGHPQRADSRRALLVAGLSALRRETSLSGVDWVFQATVLLLVAVLPTRLATPLLFWVVGGGRRPTCVRQVAGLLRRSGSRARPSHPEP